jgi:hypothetical protein
MVMLRDNLISDIGRINERGEAFFHAMSELEKVLHSYGCDRRVATLIAASVLLDGFLDVDSTAE